MKKFLKAILHFCLLFALFILLGLLLPSTPKAYQSLLLASKTKIDLLRQTPEPRLILIGGSNLSFGIDSQMLKDSLALNPINTGIHASIGLQFMMQQNLDYIQEGDIIVLVPEYQQFYNDFAYGAQGEEFVRSVFDVDSRGLKYLNIRQWKNLIVQIPAYALTKFKLKEYRGFQVDEIYTKDAFNEFGDVTKHWDLPNEEVAAFSKIPHKLDKQVLKDILKFQTAVEEKQAILYISYPGIQASSYDNLEQNIKEIDSSLKAKHFNVISNPLYYRIPVDQIFNSPYHLDKQATRQRSMQLIRDLREAGFKKF